VRDFEHIAVADSDQGWRSSLVPLLEAWIESLKQYARDPVLGRHYTPFSYNERALVSFLAAAAWRSGFLAMEEFRTRKGRKRGFGRGDLVLKLGDTVLCLEAKKSGVNLSAHPNPWPYVAKSLDKARRDAGELALDHVDHLARVGVVFLAPRIMANDAGGDERLSEGLISRLESCAQNASESLVTTPSGQVADFWAAYLPADAVRMHQAEAPGKKWLGVILVGYTLAPLKRLPPELGSAL
jgi:hypothetical protein